MKLSEARKILADLATEHRREMAVEGKTTAGKIYHSNMAEAIDTVCGTVEKPTFVILAHDRLAPDILRRWINEAASYLPDDSPKIADARSVLHAMKRWARKNVTKMPD